MAIRMAKLTRTTTGLWTARKVIPADVRNAFGKREDKPTWPATLTQGQARAEFGAWLLEIEEGIAFLRSAKPAPGMTSAPGIDLSQRQSRALAGQWYRDLEPRYGHNPGDGFSWELELEAMYPQDTEDDYRAYMRGDVRPFEGPWVPTEFLRSEQQALLASNDLKLRDAASDRLLQDMADLYVSFCQLMVRRAQGDYGRDLVLETLPDWEPLRERDMLAESGLTVMDIFNGYVAERKPADATVKAWKRMMEHLVAGLDGKRASDISPDDIIAWKDRLLTEPTKSGAPRSAKTVRETYLAAAKAVFGWAKENRKITIDPTIGVTVRGGKTQRLRDPGFSNDEALVILRATLQSQSGQLSPKTRLARRWVPWLCAYSGARVNEITQLRRGDVVELDGIWAINITPEAGSGLCQTNEAPASGA